MLNVCLSGGAIGADATWGYFAHKGGHQVKHFSFEGHDFSKLVPKNTLQVLSQKDLNKANPFLIKANLTLKRTFPTSSGITNNLLRRNWYQVRNSESVYAVSTLKDGMVNGGTAWAIQLFLDRNPIFNDMGKVFVYDQLARGWFTRRNDNWREIETPPYPSGTWTGIGSRDLNFFGFTAISDIFN